MIIKHNRFQQYLTNKKNKIYKTSNLRIPFIGYAILSFSKNIHMKISKVVLLNSRLQHFVILFHSYRLRRKNAEKCRAVLYVYSNTFSDISCSMLI